MLYKLIVNTDRGDITFEQIEKETVEKIREATIKSTGVVIGDFAFAPGSIRMAQWATVKDNQQEE